MRNWRQIAKLFVIGVKDFNYSQELKSFLKDLPVSGVALFNSPFDSPDNVWNNRDASLEAAFEFNQEILNDVHFISADQEGGRVRRLRGAFLHLPAAQALARACESPSSQQKAFELYHLAAKQMTLAGIQLNFAPVCDLQTRESHNVVGDRSYGSDPKTVIDWAQRFCQAFRTGGVLTTLKHFPGHGPSTMDSHERAALIEKPLDEYCREDVDIFHQLMSSANLLMTGHLSFPQNPDQILSMNSQMIESFLKNSPQRLPLITDDLLSMKAVSHLKPWIRAFDAPYRFILLCGDLQKSFQAIEETIRHAEESTGTFSKQQDLEKRIHQSEHFLHTKRSALSFEKWKSEMLKYENQGNEILHQLGLEHHA
jgi:beta-glucosidase-like glycosyl hydrolase